MIDLAKIQTPEKKKIIRDRITKVEKEAIGRALGYIVGAFGLVAALAWNDLIGFIFKQTLGEEETVVAKLIYAISATLIAVLVILALNRWAKKT